MLNDRTFKDTVKRYETSATDMADKFEKINEDVLRAREELAKQKILQMEWSLQHILNFQFLKLQRLLLNSS